MSRFFVGQRVRLNWKRAESTSPVSAGSEGVVVLIGPFRAGDLIPSGKRVPFNSDVLVNWVSGNKTLAIYDQLTPILPDGHRPAELSVEELLPFLSGVSA